MIWFEFDAIRQLAERRADIGLGPIAVMAERETVVDFTVPYYDLVGINILVKKVMRLAWLITSVMC